MTGLEFAINVLQHSTTPTLPTRATALRDRP